MRGQVILALALLAPLLGCQTLKEVSIGYADALGPSDLPAGAEPLRQVNVALPGLSDVDPVASPSLTRYQVTREEIEKVTATSASLESGEGCAVPFSNVALQVVGPELGPQSFATATRGADGCLSWTIDAVDLAPWFRQPTISIVAIVDGEPYDPAGLTLQVRVSFVIDVTDKPIEG